MVTFDQKYLMPFFHWAFEIFSKLLCSIHFLIKLLLVMWPYLRTTAIRKVNAKSLFLKNLLQLFVSALCMLLSTHCVLSQSVVSHCWNKLSFVKSELINTTQAWNKEENWVPNRNWTHDFSNTGRALYLLSYENLWRARSLNWVHVWHRSSRTMRMKVAKT